MVCSGEPTVPRKGRTMLMRAYAKHDLGWLRDIELFADCSDRDLDAVMRFVTPLDVPAGRVLTRQGELGRECFVVNDGATWIERNGLIGPPIRGEVAGELALIDHVPRTATVTTAVPTRVLVMSQREFTSLCRARIANISDRIDAAANAHRRALTVFASDN
jgi:CRP/FNR family transcriptional regulator, cyclic AMP receptor protein